MSSSELEALPGSAVPPCANGLLRLSPAGFYPTSGVSLSLFQLGQSHRRAIWLLCFIATAATATVSGARTDSRGFGYSRFSGSPPPSPPSAQPGRVFGFLKRATSLPSATQHDRRALVCFSSSSCSPASSHEASESLPAAASREGLLVAKGGGVRVLGLGAAVPSTRLSNADLQQVVETDDEWIRSRTGIGSRRVLQEGESLKELAVIAAVEAIQHAEREEPSPPGRPPFDILICATSSPDDLFGDGPAIAARALDNYYGRDSPRAKGIASGPPAFGLTAACSGFVAGIISDAAGAAIVAAPDCLSDPNSQLGLLSYSFNSDGAFGQDKLNVSFLQRPSLLSLKRADDTPVSPQTAQEARVRVGGGSYGCLAMKGREVFRFATSTVPASIAACLAKAGVSAKDVDFLVLHQANQRIIDVAAERLGLRSDQVLSNLESYGNTSAASIPLCLVEAIRRGEVKRGSLLALSGFGAGLTWANAVLRFG